MISHREQRRFYGAMISYNIMIHVYIYIYNVYIYILYVYIYIYVYRLLFLVLLVLLLVFEWRYPSPFAKADVTFDGGQRKMLPSCFNPNLLGLVMFMPTIRNITGVSTKNN